MNKLSTKFIIGISIILMIATLCSIVLNNVFLDQYYLYQKQTSIRNISNTFSTLLKSNKNTNDTIKQIEKTNKVIITKIESNKDMNNNEVNDEIRKSFQEKGIGFQKYWLWDKDFNNVLKGENRIRLYNQENLNYSLLIEYTYINSQLFAITMIIPNISDAFIIINIFLIFISILTIIIAIIFIYILIKKITKPLKKFEDFAIHMGHNEFIPLDIKTKDELESVATNLNSMGNQLVDYQVSLQVKNNQMEELLADVAHDLKTPVSLIKLYSDAIKDGLDDGTFLDIIAKQNDRMDQMINKLLYLSKIDEQEVILESCNISILLETLINEYTMLSNERNLVFNLNIDKNIQISTNIEWIKSILSNLITNAMKYTSNTLITISLHSNHEMIEFIIMNETNNKELDIKKIFNPYYVGEKSRNKHLSGTGLGLPLVKKLVNKLNYDISCSYIENTIVFKLVIPN